jgi:hypothetical protein
LKERPTIFKGETYNIYYEFDAPDVSPYLFTLGALEIGNWKEARQWMIASDSPGIIRPDGDSTPLQWSVTGGTGTHASAINEVVVNTSDYVDNGGTQQNKDQYTMGDISGIGVATTVKVWVYAKCTKKDSAMDVDLYWTGGSATTQHISTSSTANRWEWASTTYSGLTLGQADLNSLEVKIKGQSGGRTYYVATLYADVTYTEPTWVSDRESYDSTYHIVYMSGGGFKLGHDYKVAYYDGSGAKVQTEFTNTSSGTGTLESQYDFTKNSGATYGDWHSVVLDGPAPNTYDAAIADANYVIDDGFYVAESAIPEFPTVIAAIAVCMLCAIPYMVMRRSGGRGDG